MLCGMCNDVELTPIEETEKTSCLRCAMLLKAKQTTLGIESPPINHVDYGRSLEEKKEFEDYVNSKTLSKNKASSKPQKSLGLSGFGENSDFLNNGVELRQIAVHGSNEDVELKLTLPIFYHIPERHFTETKKILEVCLKIIIHTLAFGPLENTSVEEFLIEKFKLIPDPKKRDGEL